jgi:leucine dehydrogenase
MPKTMKLRKHQLPGFEESVTCYDETTGLKAVIVIHDTHSGPALGGIRMHPYTSDREAVEDAMLLAKAMTYKARAANLKLGGGKAVIIGDPMSSKNERLLRAMGRFVNHLEGRYLAAKDAGITTDDLVEVASETRYVTGLPEPMGGSGDPSPWTAIGILEGMRACLKEKSGRTDFRGLSVAIQGVGHVGLALAELLHQEEAKLIVSDTNAKLLEYPRNFLKAKTVDPDRIYDLEADIFSPCALGGIINDDTVNRLRCSIIAGGANNQLADETKNSRRLHEREILYAPDYIINAGGLINIYVGDILKEDDSIPWIEKIRDRLAKVFALSKEKQISTAQAADMCYGSSQERSNKVLG